MNEASFVHYKTGNQLIDSQHWEIFQLITSIKESILSEITFKEKLIFLLVLLKMHFSDEEKLMVKINYPYFAPHRDRHADLVGLLSKHIKNHGIAPFGKYSIDLLDELFTGHINDHDLQLANYMKRNPQ